MPPKRCWIRFLVVAPFAAMSTEGLMFTNPGDFCLASVDCKASSDCHSMQHVYIGCYEFSCQTAAPDDQCVEEVDQEDDTFCQKRDGQTYRITRCKTDRISAAVVATLVVGTFAQFLVILFIFAVLCASCFPSCSAKLFCVSRPVPIGVGLYTCVLLITSCKENVEGLMSPDIGSHAALAVISGAISMSLSRCARSRYYQHVAGMMMITWMSNVTCIAKYVLGIDSLVNEPPHAFATAGCLFSSFWMQLYLISKFEVAALRKSRASYISYMKAFFASCHCMFITLGAFVKLGAFVNELFIPDFAPIRAILACMGILVYLVVESYVARTFVFAYKVMNSAELKAEPSCAKRLSRAKWTAIAQLSGSTLAVATAIPVIVKSSGVGDFWWSDNVDYFANIVACLILSNSCSGGFARAVKAEHAEAKRLQKRNKVLRMDAKSPWAQKVQELSERSITLLALINFCKELGEGIMEHFDPMRHTTEDVVRQAIIPGSAHAQTDYANVLMEGVRGQAQVLVTHNWSNSFIDLVAAIIAEALGETEYERVSHLLACRDFDTLEGWLYAAGALDARYWICAFCVNQHSSICDRRQMGSVDPVTGYPHPICCCGASKVLNWTEPRLDNGESIFCELNKFDDIMNNLAAADPSFRHIIAVDHRLEIFGRAWCMSEIHKGDAIGLLQHIVVPSIESIENHEDSLRDLRIENMKASRPEDVMAILYKIDDTSFFNRTLQGLIFDLISNWKSFDAEQQLVIIGSLSRYEIVSQRRRSNGLWNASISRPQPKLVGTSTIHWL